MKKLFLVLFVLMIPFISYSKNPIEGQLACRTARNLFLREFPDWDWKLCMYTRNTKVKNGYQYAVVLQAPVGATSEEIGVGMIIAVKYFAIVDHAVPYKTTRILIVIKRYPSFVGIYPFKAKPARKCVEDYAADINKLVSCLLDKSFDKELAEQTKRAFDELDGN